MPQVQFLRSISTIRYGTVSTGDTVDVSDVDRDRFVRAGWADEVKPKRTTRKAAASGMTAEADD